MNKVVIHIFHDDAASLGTGSHVSERIRQIMNEKGVTLEVFVFGPAQKALFGPAQTGFRDTLAALVKNGVPVHICRQIAESMGNAEESTQLGLTLEYAREAFVRYAQEGATVISF
ncbi:MAG: DsrE family protein [Gammaproteobacteria bacterium]